MVALARIQTSCESVKAAVRGVREDTASVFGGRCVALYVMGSLARGGFSPAVSDIDLGVVLAGPLEPGDPSSIDAIVRRARERHTSLPNPVSIFWGSVESLNGSALGGRFPPFDRLDLIDCALLLHGRDVRAELVRPELRELVAAGAAFALERLGSDDRLAEFREVERLASSGIVHLTKTVLFPARLVYLERSGEVAGNDVSARHYCDHFNGPDAELVANALGWRSGLLPPVAEIEALLERGLSPLYLRFLNVYVSRLEAFGDTALVARLIRWRETLCSYPS